MGKQQARRSRGVGGTFRMVLLSAGIITAGAVVGAVVGVIVGAGLAGWMAEQERQQQARQQAADPVRTGEEQGSDHNGSSGSTAS